MKPMDEPELEVLCSRLEVLCPTLELPQFDIAVGPQESSAFGVGNAALEQVHEFSSPPQKDDVEQHMLPQQVVPVAQ